MNSKYPEHVDPTPWLGLAADVTDAQVRAAIYADSPSTRDFVALLSPIATRYLEAMAQRARSITAHRFGRVISIYAPLYLSNHCSGGCEYCGFASEVTVERTRLDPDQLQAEFKALKTMGLDEVLLLTGDRLPEADFSYVSECVSMASDNFHSVVVEAFPMTTDEYRELIRAGCTGVTVYQETYNPVTYKKLHSGGSKANYEHRLQTPGRALEAGIRTVGVGVLLGLHDPIADLISLFQHTVSLRGEFWKSGVSVSFPRVRPQRHDYVAPHPVSDTLLAQAICAFRIALPDVPLVLSTRESPSFRDSMAGIGISKMSAASRTTVGGYAAATDPGNGQFETSDRRDIEAFSCALAKKGLSPVLKDWEAVYRG